MTNVQPPTSRLPPIAAIASFTVAQLSESVRYLQALYRPHVRGSRRRREALEADDEELVRSDPFERAYAIRWLTTLIARLEGPSEDTDALVQQAASLLAICAGVAAAGRVQRRFTFDSTFTGPIHVDLTDIPLDNHDYGSVGAQTWGGACVLAEMIVEHPERFGLRLGSPRPLRILELGAGTGLVGLTVAKLLQAAPPSPTRDPPCPLVVLTDFYPAVLANLASNVTANFPSDADGATVHVTSHLLDWSSFSTTSKAVPTPEPIVDVLSTPFDLVLGADIVYEAQHAVWIRDCLASLLARPNGSDEDPTFHLVIPLRPTHTFESGTVEAVFSPKERTVGESQPELTIFSKESILCEAYGDGAMDDDVEYVYYRIGWSW